MTEPTAARGPNPIAAALQAVVGLLVPPPLARIFRPAITSRDALLRNGSLLVIAAPWLLILLVHFLLFAVLGFPPSPHDPPKFDPLTAKVVIFAILRGLAGVFLTQAFWALAADW